MPNTNTYKGPTDPVLLFKGKLIQKEIICEILLKAYYRKQAFSDMFQAILISLKEALQKPAWLNHITQGNKCLSSYSYFQHKTRERNHYCLFTVMVIM